MRVWPSWITDNSSVKAEFNNCFIIHSVVVVVVKNYADR